MGLWFEKLFYFGMLSNQLIIFFLSIGYGDNVLNLYLYLQKQNFIIHPGLSKEISTTFKYFTWKFFLLLFFKYFHFPSSYDLRKTDSTTSKIVQ